MDTQQLKQALINEAKLNPASSAVLHMFALRERARGTVNLGSLHQAMKREGYLYQKSDYRSILEVLVKQGVGVGVYNKKQLLTGIKNITVQLQSLGRMAIQDSGIIQEFKKRNHYRPVLVPTPPKLVQKPVEKQGVVIEFPIQGSNTPIRLTVGSNLSAGDLTSIIQKLTS